MSDFQTHPAPPLENEVRFQFTLSDSNEGAKSCRPGGSNGQPRCSRLTPVVVQLRPPRAESVELNKKAWRNPAVSEKGTYIHVFPLLPPFWVDINKQP